jgi:holo-[acyl-carrier protein] synthase
MTKKFVKIMENVCLGVDIENISRFKDIHKIKDKRFLDKIFTQIEIDYCFKKIKPEQHLAVRFAAKEAIIKACNSICNNILSFGDIEIVNNDNGIPLVHIKKNEFSSMDIKLSLSHNNDNAIAFVLISRSGFKN